jgi:hypothetical protein
MKDVGALGTVQKRLDLFGKIDAGEIDNFDQLRGLDLTTSQARSYLGASPEMRETMKERVTGEIGRRQDFVKSSIDTLAKYQEEMKQYKGRTTDLTDVEGVKDFANWLSYNVGSGAVQLAPIMIAAATTGPAGVAALGTSMGVSEAVGNRMQALAPKLEGLNPDQKAAAVIDYVTKTGDTSLAVGIVSGAFDTILGPAATLAKRGLSQVVKGETRTEALKAGIKELPKQAGEEFITGGAQEATQIAGAVREGEVEKFLTKENAKKILNAAAAEAAGSLGGTGATTAARVYGADKAESAKEKALGEAFAVPGGEERAPYVKPEATDLESLARSKGFLQSQPKTASDLATELAKPPAVDRQAVPESESQDMDAMMAELEAQLEGKPAPVKAEAPELDVKQQLTPEPTVTELRSEEPKAEEVKVEPAKVDLVTEAYKYNTPDLRLQQSDAFGVDVTTALYQETESYGRAALKNRGLTDGYAKKKDSIADAADAATVAFGTGDYSVFAPYAQTFPKLAKKLETHLATETKAEPVTADATGMTPKERLRRANVSMFNAQRMLADGQITADQYDDLKRQYASIKLQASDIAEKAKQPIVPATEPKGEYKEEKSLDTFFANYKEDKKRLDDLPKYGQPEVKQVVAELNQAIQKVTDAINAKGYSASAIKHKLPAELRPFFDQFSALTGGGSRLLMESERVGNNKKLANPEKLAKAVKESQDDIANTYKFLGIEPEVTQPPAAPSVTAAKPARKVAKETPLRRAAYTKNPLMTFLASRGLYHVKGEPNSQMSEFNAGRQIMVSGYGPVFKASGMQLDEMLPIAIEYGYLPQDATESDLSNLISKAVSGKKVEPLYSEQGVEDTAAKYEERMAEEETAYEERGSQSDAEWYGMAEDEYINMMASEVAELSSEELAALEDSVGNMSDVPASNVSVRAAMEALGFTEEEIQNEERRTAAKADETATREEAIPKDSVRLYHSGEVGEGETGRWVSTNREYASNYRPDLPLFYLDVKADDPRVNNPDYPDQGAKQGFTFNFEVSGKESKLRDFRRA